MLKKFSKVILTVAFLLFAAASVVRAVVDMVAISDLPEYLNTDTFKLSYSALSANPVTAQFYIRKDIHPTWRKIDGVINGASGQVQVTGGDIYDGQGLYRFKVEINGAAADETTTNIDFSGPSPVQNYRKEMVGGGHYRLHWKNPGDDDLSRVLIYRSTETQFTADGLTKVGELGGGPDNEMTWDNVGLDSNKTYYYALRAVDKAGNGSSIVSDPETQVTVLGEAVAAEAEGEAEGEVVLLPKEEREGEVLAEEEEAAREAAAEEEALAAEAAEEAKPFLGTTVSKVIWGVAGVAGLWLLYYFFRRRKRP